MNSAVEPVGELGGTTVRYNIDTKGSTFTIRAFATGILASLGHNPTISATNFEGEVFLDTNALDQSSMKMLIPADSLTVIDDIRDKDRVEINGRMQQDVLESNSFENIVYECSRTVASKTAEGQYWVALNGDLTLHGVMRSQPVSARVSVNGETLRATGDFSIRLSDYEIKPVTALGGAVKLKDELKLSFDITARKRA